MYTANCLQLVGVEAGDSRDSSGRERFLALNLEFYVSPEPMDPNHWYWRYLYYPAVKVNFFSTYKLQG